MVQRVDNDVSPILSPSGRWLAFRGASSFNAVSIVDTCTASVRARVRIGLRERNQQQRDYVAAHLADERDSEGNVEVPDHELQFNDRGLLQYGDYEWEPWSGRLIPEGASPGPIPACDAALAAVTPEDGACTVEPPAGWRPLSATEPLSADSGIRVAWGLYGEGRAATRAPRSLMRLHVCDSAGRTVSRGELPVVLVTAITGQAESDAVALDAGAEHLFQLDGAELRVWNLRSAQLEDIAPNPYQRADVMSALSRAGNHRRIQVVGDEVRVCASDPIPRHSAELALRCYASWNRQTREWSVIERQPVISEAEMAALGISTDVDADASDRWVVVPDESWDVRALDRRTGRAWRTERRLGHMYSNASLAPDGSTLITSMGSRIAVWDLERRVEVGEIPSESDGIDNAMSVKSYAVSPTRPRLYTIAHVWRDGQSFHDRFGDTLSHYELVEWDLESLAPLRSLTRVGSRSTDREIAISPDGRYLVVGDEGGVHVFRGPELREHLWYPTAEGDLPVRFTFQGDFLVAMGVVTSLHRLDTPRPTTVLVHYGRSEDAPHALFYTPDGRFTGDEELFGEIWFRTGDEPEDDLLSADAAFEAFHEPSLMRRFVEGGRSAAGSPAALGRAPRIEVTRLASRQPDAATQRFSLRVDDHGGGVSEIRVYVNGARQLTPRATLRAGEASEDQSQDGSGRTRGLQIVGAAAAARSPVAEAAQGLSGAGEHTLEVPLAPGENLITVEAYSEVGAVRGNRASFAVTRTGTAPLPRLHVLAISVAEYAEPELGLPLTHADAEAILAALRSGASDLYRVVEPTWLRGESATREAILESFQTISAQMDPEDVFVLYAASHGALVACGGSREYQLLLRGTTEAAPCADRLAMSELSRLVGELPAQRKLVMLDTCQSGAAISETSMETLYGLRRDQMEMASRQGVAIIAASASSQVAYEDPELGHGLFTVALLRGLSGRASLRPDGPIGVRNLVDYVSRQLPFLAARHVGSTQTPAFGATGTDFLLGRVSDDAAPSQAVDDRVGRSAVGASAEEER